MDVSIANVLTECQRSTSTHRRAAVALHKLRHSQTETERSDGQFMAAFLAATDRVLAVYRREPAVERVAAFIVEFVASVANTPGVVDVETGINPSAQFLAAFMQV